MKINHYNQAMKWITRPKEKPMPITKYIDTMNRLYGSDGGAVEAPEKKEDKKWKYESWADQKEEAPVKVAGIKDSALYKLLENPKVLGVELGHDTIMQVIQLIQNPGIVKKPKKESIKVAVVKKPEEKIDHIALLANGDEFV
jgi:hypothetical protein